jgi:FlaG/FlaF family flagellin (archaellin)
MDLELRKKKAWSEFGVSEIIGNILILMITVTLFSGIMAFVQQMPVPQQATKADFAAKVTFWNQGHSANLTVTHTGGDSIKAKDCIALVELGSVNTRYNMSNSILGLKGTTTWSTGIAWTVTLSGTTYSSKIAVTIVDMVKKSAIWSSQVTGGTSGNAPNILQRYVDSDNQTPTADPVREWQDFSFYVTITDPDGDLNTTTPGVWIDSSQLETDRATSYSMYRTDYTKNGDTFQWDFTSIRGRNLNASKLDGKIIFIHAWDNAGHQSISSFTMSIVQLPVDIKYQDINPPEPNPSGDSNLPSYIRWFYDNQGFGVFAEKILNGTPMGAPNTTTIVTSFAKDQLVFVRFASKVMANIFTENKLLLTDIRTGLQVIPLFNGSSTASKPFYPITGGGGVYVYESQFNTSPVSAGAFTLTISLKNQPSTGEVQRIYGADKTIFITDSSSSISFWPAIYLYKDPTHNTLWGNKSTPYEVTSPDKYKVYVAIKVQDLDTPKTPSIADIRISDGSQSSELFGIPGSGSMISTTDGYSTGSPPTSYYTFSIDLRLNNGVQWRGGNNTYTLHIAKMNDSNEGLYSLSEQIFINGAGSRADFFAGTTGMAGGGSNFASREYLFYIQNSNLFASRTMWRYDATPPAPDYSVTAMGIGDIDGDGDKDVLIGQATDSKALLLFENTLNTFGTWQSGSAISRPDAYTSIVTWIAFGDVNGDGMQDFAYSNSNGQVVIYNTTYGSIGWVFTPPSNKSWSAPINKIYLQDMTGDGRADLVVMGANKIYIYDLKYFYTTSLMAQKSWDKKGVYAVSTGTITDFDIKDVDYDGHLDIITSETVAAFGGLNGVNVNFWREATSPTTRYLDVNATGFLPKYGPGNFSGTVAQTKLVDNIFMTFTENSTGIDAEKGKVSATMRFEPLSSSPDQQLRIVARIGAVAGNGNEVFYAWYSVDNVVYTPVITIDSTSWKWYNYTLPSSVAGKTVYLKFTDSNQAPSSGTPTDYVQVDMAKIVSDLFGIYQPTRIKDVTTWTSVRGASIDGSPSGDKYLEIVAAKDGAPWTIYQYNTSWTETTPIFASGASYPGAVSSFFVKSAGKYATPFSTVAATLFDAVDINGDGFTDILVTNYTTTTTNNNYVGFYMNLWDGTNSYWRYFSVKSWLIDKPTGSNKDTWITITAVANLTVTT